MKDSGISMYTCTSFTTIPAPEWLIEAGRLCRPGGNLQDTISVVLESEQQSLNPVPIGGNEYDFSFWRLETQGIYVEINSAFGPYERILVPEDADWLPFMQMYLTPLLAAVSQMETASQLQRLTNAAIAFMRYGEGNHLERHRGLSRIDLDNDGMRRHSAAFRAELLLKNKGS
ncbi:MAG: hypothetical protein ACI92Z_003391 [Paracoccaceae bacterium]|jgi:hypothetical protein